MDDKRKLLYNQLSNDYDLGDFESFSSKLDDEEKRKVFYDAVSKDYDLGDYESFVGKIKKPAAQIMREQSTGEPYTHEYDEQGNLIGGTAYEAPEPYQYKPEVQQYILQNKPEMFKSNKGSLLDKPLNLSEEQPEPMYQPRSIVDTVNDAYEMANKFGERVNARAEIAKRNLEDPAYQKSKNKVEVRSLTSDIDAELSEVEDKIASRKKTLRGNPMAREDRGLAQYRGDRTYLEGAKELMEESQKIINAAKDSEDGTFIGGVLRGTRDKAFDVDTWTMGVSDLVGGLRLKKVLEDFESGKQLTSAQEKLLDAAVTNMATTALFNSDLGAGYVAGQVTGESLPFTLEMMINPISASGNAMAKSLLNAGLKRFAKNKAAQVGTRMATDALAATGMAATTGLPGVLGDAVERTNRNYKYGVDFDGNLYVEKKGDTSFGEALGRSFATRAIENQSEMIFNAFKSVGGLMKGVNEVLPGGVNKFFDLLKNNKAADAYRAIKNSKVFRNYLVKDFRNATQIGGYVEEAAEEVYNNLANFAIGEMSWDELTDLDNNIDMLLGLAPTQVMFGLLGLGGAGAMRYQTRRTLEDLQATMNEQQRKELEGLLDMGLDAREVDVRGFIRNVMQNENYTIDNKRDMIKAAFYVAKQNGIDELTQADVVDKVSAENSIIDSVTDPSTGMYSELTATLSDGNGGQAELPGYIVGWLGEGDKAQPIFVPEGMENTYENRRVLKPGQWKPEDVQQMPAEEVKALNEEMIREEAAVQAENEARWNPNVPEPQEGLSFFNGEEEVTIVGMDGNGGLFVAPGDEYRAAQGNEKKMAEVVNRAMQLGAVPVEQYKDAMTVQLEADEKAPNVKEPVINGQAVVHDGDTYQVLGVDSDGVQVQNSKGITKVPLNIWKSWVYDYQQANKPSEVTPSESVGEQVNAGVNTEVNNSTTSVVQSETAPQGAIEGNTAQETTESWAGIEATQPTLEQVVASLPKTNKGEIDYRAMTPQQQFQYTSLSESPEVALEDLQADIAANEEEIAKVQEQLAKARGGQRAELRDKAKKLTSANEELKTFYGSVAPKQEIPVVETEPIEPVNNEVQEAVEEAKPIVVETEKPKKAKKPKLVGKKKKKDSEFTDEELRPANGVELAAEQFAAGNVKITIDSYKKETGHGEEERKKMGLTPFRGVDKGGLTIEQAAEKLVEEDNANHNGRIFDGDTMAARDAIIELFGSTEKWGDVTGYIKNNRIAEQKKREEAEYAEYEAYLMESLHVTPEELELLNEAEEQRIYELSKVIDEVDAIFAEAELERQNNEVYEQGRIIEGNQGQSELLSEKRVGDLGGNQRDESQRGTIEVGGTSEYNSQTPQESASGSEVAPSIEAANVGRMADIEARILEIEGRRNEISDEIAEMPDYDTLAIAELRAEEWELDQEQAELEAEYSGLSSMNDESRAIIEAEGGEVLFRSKGKRTGTPKDDFVKRAEEWSEKTGVKIRFANRLSDVSNREARQQLLRGEKITGWYEKSTGEVVLYLPNLSSMEEVDATYIHEVVAHKGMSGLLGDRFNEFLDSVWDMMSLADKRKYWNYPGVSSEKNEEDRRRAAADEYIANTFESIDVTESVWSKLTDLIKRFLKAIGIEPRMTNADIANTIKKSYQRLLSGEGAEGNMSGEGVRFNAKKKRALETVSTSRKKHQQTVISSADGAKILNNLDNLAEKYENDTHTKEKTFIGEVAKAIEARKQGSGSQYSTFETVNGKIVTIRLADHNATVSNFDNRDESEGISIVVSAKDNNGITNDGDSHIVEYFYDSIDLRRADGKPLAEIVKSIKQSLYSGEYKDTTGLAERQEVNESRFRVVNDKNGNKSLIGLHNISEEKLRKAIKQGGLANPSMAVIDMDKQSHVDYGDITLIAPESLVNKKTGRNVGTYTADAYTPVYPTVTKQISNKGAKAFTKALESVDETFRNRIRLYFNNYLDSGTMYDALFYWYLSDTGKNPPILEAALPDGYTRDEVKNVKAVNPDATIFAELSEEERRKVIDLYIEREGGKEKYEDDLANRVEGWKKSIEDGNTLQMRKKFSQDKLNELEEYGYEYDRIANYYKYAIRLANASSKPSEIETFRNAYDEVVKNGLEEDFGNWLMAKEEELGVEEKLFAGYDNQGRAKYVPNTLLNASKLMKKEGRAGAAGLGGFNYFVAILAPVAKNTKQISAKKQNLSTQEEYDKFAKKWGEYYHKLALQLQPGADKWADYGYHRLHEIAPMANPKDYAKKEYGLELSDKFIKDLNDVKNAIKSDFPARYFETKFERPVYLNEFAAAVVPEGTSKDIVSALTDAGLPVEEYKKGNNEARMDAVDKVSSEIDGIRFRRVYHGSGASFDRFDHSFMGTGEGNQSFGWGTYVTDSQGIGKQYAKIIGGEPVFTYKGMSKNEAYKMYPELQYLAFFMDRGDSAEEAIERRKSILNKVINTEGVDWFRKEMAEKSLEVLDSLDSSEMTMTKNRHLYEVEIPDNNGTNYLSWEEPLTEEQKERIKAALTKTDEYKSYAEKYGKELSEERVDTWLSAKGGAGRVYRFLENFFEDSDNSSKAVSELLSDAGFVGMEYSANYYGGGNSYGDNNYVIFNEHDLDIVEHTRFRIANRNQEIFVSNAERAVEGIKQEKATPQQWLAMIEKNGGLKAGEDKWLGLSDWLKESDKKSLTKDEILDFIDQNKIRIEEVKYGGINEELVNAQKELSDFYGEMMGKYGLDYEENMTAQEKEREERLIEAQETAKLHDINPTRLNYTTEGLENKQEIALTVPTIEPWNVDDEIHFGDAGEGRAVAWIRFGETTTPNVAFVNAREAVNNYIAEMREKYNVKGGGIYDVMNEEEVKHLQELTSAEFDTRDKVEHVLVIDEIQSKRHQEGREHGYGRTKYDNYKIGAYKKQGVVEVADIISDNGNTIGYVMHDEYGYWGESLDGNQMTSSRDTQEEAASVLLNTFKIGIPEAPFEKNWHELAMKRMLRYAAENGFDKVAWTKGAQQADRYNLRNVVNSIAISKSSKEEGKYHLTSYDKEDMPIDVASGNKTPEELAELFGKAVANELIEGVNNLEDGRDTFILEGAALEVGGEGMKGFYDKMLPSFVNKYVKKWGTKVQDVELPNVEEAGRFMHSVDVTDAMKESVMEGQTMFRIKRDEAQRKVDEFTSKYNSKPVFVVDSAMKDKDLEAVFDGKATAKELREVLNKPNAMGGYVNNLDKIIIFADKAKAEKMENILFHENVHAQASTGKYNRLISYLYEFGKDNKAFARWKRMSDREEYKEYQRPEEFLSYTLADGMERGELEDVLNVLEPSEKESLFNLLKEVGYEYEEESRRRRLDGSLSGKRSDNAGLERTDRPEDGGREEAERISAREQAERLKELFGKVADMGLNGVLGNGHYDKAMMDIYRELPEDARQIVSGDALGRPKVDFIGAMSDYLNNAEISIWDRVIGIIRDAIRKIGFDVELNTNDVKYILWRSRKPLDRNNLVEVAEDIDMRYRLKVGEYNGSPTDGSILEQIKQARADVERNPTEAQKEAGNYKKGHITLDGFEITLENPKGGTRSGVDKNGKKWSITMNNDYGYIRGTEAVDGDHIDVFLSDNPTEGSVFVVDQSNEDGTFDESKVMYGFNSLGEARNAYLSNYENGWESRIMAITEVSKDEFKKWIDSSRKKTKPFSEYKSVNSGNGNTRFRAIDRVNEKFNEELSALNEENADKVELNLGSPSAILRAAGVEDKPMKLYGNKVIKKMKKHGFNLDELRDLPNAVADPIAVFENYGEIGNRSILTELKTEQGNFLVTLSLGKGHDIDFNIVTSVFGKGENNIVDWIEKGYGVYYNKKKTLDYLHHSALKAVTSDNQGIDSATKIVEYFENPKVEEGNVRFKAKKKAEIIEENKELKEEVKDLRSELKDLKKQVNSLRSGNKEEWEKKQRAIISFVKGRLTKEAGSVFGKTRLDQLLTLLNKASTATDLYKPLRFVEQVINDASIEHAAAKMDKLIKTRLQGETNRGVAKGVVVDEATRRLFDSIRGTFKDLISTSIDSELRHVRGEILRFGKEINALPEDDIQGRNILKARQDAMKQRRDELEKEQEELQRQNILETKESLRKRYDELVDAMDAHVDGRGVWTQEMQDEYDSIPLREKLAEIREAQAQLDAIMVDALQTRRIAYKNTGAERKKLLAEAEVLDNNYTIAQEELMRLMNEVSDELTEIIKEGKSRLAIRKQALAERRRTIVGMGISAVKDKKIKEPNAILTKKEKFEKWFDNSWMKSFSDFMTAPLNSFNFMLKYIDRNHTIGQGELYKHFMKSEEGALEANNRLYDGLKAYNTAIEEKAKEIFGKDIEKVMKESGKTVDGVVRKQFMYDSANHNEGDMYPISISKGQALYVWLTWRQDDGRAKLLADGWNDQSIEEIESFIGEDYMKFGEWITDEYFPALREEKYNKTHIEMFGTSMAKREHYFPFKIQSQDIQEKGEMGESYEGMPSTITGNIIKRTINKSRINTEQNAFDMIFKYGNDMETWNAMAELRQDLNFLHASKAFRNYLEANSKGLFDKFMKAAEVAVKAYNNSGESNAINDFFVKLNRMWAGTNIGFRLNTAMKQVLSYPAFMAYSGNVKYQSYLMKYMLNWVGNYNWAKENLPAFRNRVESGNMGMTGMTDPTFDLGKAINKFGEWGMVPNQLVDALTCAAGARSVYDFEYNRAKKAGMGEEEAKNVAQYNAEIAFNETQQSSREEFVSPIQMSRNALMKSMMNYQNSNVGYQRMGNEGLLEFIRAKHVYLKDIESGMDESEAWKKMHNSFLRGMRKMMVAFTILPGLWYLGGRGIVGITSPLLSSLFGGGGDDEPYLDDEAKTDLMLSIVLGTVAGTSGGQAITSMVQGREYEPMAYVKEFSKVITDAVKDGFNLNTIKNIALKMSKFGGVNVETFENIYLGVEHAIRTGNPDLVDFMLLINLPPSQRKKMAEELYSDMPFMEYAEKVARAQKLFDDYRKHFPYAKTDKNGGKANAIKKQYVIENLSKDKQEKLEKEKEYKKLKREYDQAEDKNEWLEEHPEYKELETNFKRQEVTKEVNQKAKELK